VEEAQAAYVRLVELMDAQFTDVPSKTLRRKMARQAARAVLPNATETKIVVTANARAWRLAGALCVTVVTLDQVAKALIEGNMVPGEHVDVLGPLGFTLAHNEGVAFGLASGGGAALVALTVVALIFVGVLFAHNPTRPWMWVAFGLLAGGAFGNLVDRVRVGAVTDYVDVFSWPPFNLADVAITLGVVVLALCYVGETDR